MRFLLTLLALIAGFATPGMTVVTARAQVAGAEQVESAGSVAQSVVVVRAVAQEQRAAGTSPRPDTVSVVDCGHAAGCSIALSDRPLE